ncbi:TPA: DEAD/DEAH box helicase, partial [Acinetobacter baumannii]
ANKAVEQLRSDISQNYDHLVMARVNEKPKAEELLAIYQSIAPEFNPIVVHSGLTSSENNQKLEELKTRHSRIVICVDMLGEGYDLPNLKIAALHDQHKSLAITLQFIGRFTRSSSNTPIGDASAIANIADVDIQGGLQKLYAQDANWDLILKRLSEERINNEIKLQDVIDSLRGNGGLDKQISLWNLRPSYSAMLFKTECQEWGISSLESLNLRFAQTWHAISNEDKILIILGVRNTPVNWGKFEDIDDTNHYIFILNWDEEREAVFVYSNDHDAFKTEDIAKVICGENTIQITGETIFKVLDNVQLPLVKNLGSSQVGAISFTQFFGPNVTDGLSQ